MSFLTNKHFIVALLVAPILAIFAWYAADMMVAETPIKPETGKSYKLAERPGCRWASGLCSVKNNNFEIEITVNKTQQPAVLNLRSNFPLDGAQVALFLVKTKQELAPVLLTADDERALTWQGQLDWIDTGENRLHLGVKQNGALYYGDVATTFVIE